MASNKQVTNADVLNEVAALRARIEELMASQPPKAAKASKPKDPDAPKKAPNAWILFTGRVRTALKDNGLPAGREAQQYASFLKNSIPNAYEMTPEDILSHHAEWTPPDPKPKEETAAEPKPKPKRTISAEHLAKMQAGKRAAAERRKAEEAAAKAVEAEAEDVESEAEDAPPSPKAPPRDLKPFPLKGKKLLKDSKTGGCWENKDGVPGEWKGVYNAETKTLDVSVPEPK